MEQLEGLLPDNLRDFYKFIGSSTQEIYIKYWTLFSIDNIIERRKIIMEDGIEVTDFGMRYCGMGHCKIAFYDKNTLVLSIIALMVVLMDGIEQQIMRILKSMNLIIVDRVSHLRIL